MKQIESLLKQGEAVQFKKSRSARKAKGVFYTPFEVIDYMVRKILEDIDLAGNPYVRILDPACGSGLFLIKVFEVLMEKFEGDYHRISSRNKDIADKLRREDIGRFIVENNLWGADIDSSALNAARDSLAKLAGGKCKTNLLCCDSLVSSNREQISFFDEPSQLEEEFWRSGFDYIVGNPPYIGHKKVPNDYKRVLQQLYSGIYADKSDISYCFIKRGIDLLREGGSLSFITSRYFMEGPSAAGLRKYIRENCSVTDIVDFQGRKVFADAGVAACIINMVKAQENSDVKVAKCMSKDVAGNSDSLFEQKGFEHFTIKKSNLKDEGWILVDSDSYEIFSIVEGKGTHTLEEVFESYQGIITGCDKAFILDRHKADEYGIEEGLLRPWIKNSNIGKLVIKPPDKYIIYTDFIENERNFPNTIKYVRQYRDKLLERRECKNGVRKWYQLQWGRKSEVFEAPKIVYPFKSQSNRFAVDNKGYYCSADVYSLQLKKEFKEMLSLEYTAAVLNSKLFEFYFKCYAKRISSSLYDYYPNTVLRLRLIIEEMNPSICQLLQRLKKCKNEEEKKQITNSIDREVYVLYGISERQIKIIENRVL